MLICYTGLQNCGIASSIVTANVRPTRKSSKEIVKTNKQTKQLLFFSESKSKYYLHNKQIIKYDDKLHFLDNKSDTFKYLSNKGGLV